MREGQPDGNKGTEKSTTLSTEGRMLYDRYNDTLYLLTSSVMSVMLPHFLVIKDSQCKT